MISEEIWLKKIYKDKQIISEEQLQMYFSDQDRPYKAWRSRLNYSVTLKDGTQNWMVTLEQSSTSPWKDHTAPLT